MNLPEAFVDRMAVQLGDELPAFLHSYEEPYQRGIRLNPCKGGERLTEHFAHGELLERVPWEPTAYYLSMASRAGAAVLHEAGAWYLQEPSAMIPVAVLAPTPGERVLDLCAAPGGKSTQLGLRMAGQGTLVCNEPIRDRAKILSRNIERMGIPNAVVTCAYPEMLEKMWPEAFDAIQCDAPCSGEGMFRRHPETRDEWTPDAPAGCAKRQAEILDSAARMLRPGGRLVYSTCTLNHIENEAVIETFLQRHPDFVCCPFTLPGLDAPTGMLTVYPHRVRGEGHFVALLRKRTGNAGMAWEPAAPSAKMRSVIDAALPGMPDGVQPNLASLVTTDARFEEYVLEYVPELPGGKLPNVSTLRLGMKLGSVRLQRERSGKPPVFTPDHAWAVSIAPPDVPRVMLTEEQARLYQSGQTIPAEGRGWVLACFADVALGWGKISDGTLKNHYPKGLRR